MSNNNNFKRTTVLLTKDTYKKLKIMAIEKDRNMSECIEEAIKEYLKKKRT